MPLRPGSRGWAPPGSWVVLLALAIASACGGRSRSSGRALAAAATSSTAVPAPVTVAPGTAPPTATTAAPPTSPAAGTSAGAFAVGVHASTLVDATRPTPATSAGPGAGQRTLPTTVWYPARGSYSAADVPDAPPATGSGPFPLVVWGHGWNLTGRDYQSFLHRWASAGYVIAAPDFPTSTSGRPGGAGPAGGPDERAEPGDLSFVATSVTRMSADPSSLLAGLVDARRVVAAGHSQGAVDALAMTFAACCRDARVRVAVIVAGIDVPELFGAYQFTTTHSPVLLEQGDRDPYLSVDGARGLYARLASPKFLLVLRGTDHNVSKGDAVTEPTRTLADAVVDFSDRYLKGGAAGRLGRDVGAAAFAQLVASP